VTAATTTAAPTDFHRTVRLRSPDTLVPLTIWVPSRSTVSRKRHVLTDRAVDLHPLTGVSTNDLMMGAYKHLLLSSTNWNRLEWPLDHALFLELLELIRAVRNELMHFAPDPLDEETLTRVEGFIEMLRIVDPRP
jgi:hypothetical protein